MENIFSIFISQDANQKVEIY